MPLVANRDLGIASQFWTVSDNLVQGATSQLALPTALRVGPSFVLGCVHKNRRTRGGKIGICVDH